MRSVPTTEPQLAEALVAQPFRAAQFAEALVAQPFRAGPFAEALVAQPFRTAQSAQRLQVRQNIVHLVIGVLSKLLDVRLQRIVDGERHLVRGKRSMRT